MATEPLVKSFLGITEYTANSRPFSVEHICGGVAMMLGMGIMIPRVWGNLGGCCAFGGSFPCLGERERGARLLSVIFLKKVFQANILLSVIVS